VKLISLNVWLGKLDYRLFEFLEEMSDAIDIFCLQEVSLDLHDKLLKILSEYNGYLGEYYTSFDERLAIFVRKKIRVEDIKEITLCKNEETELRGKAYVVGSKLQYLTFAEGRKNFIIANVHGLWVKKLKKTDSGKSDTAERIAQSQRINNILDKFPGSKILCGDFNLLPSTDSISMLEKNGMRNLIKEYRITSTRSRFFPANDARFADYVFTSPQINILDFKVLKNEVSDHLPLFLEFS